MRAELQKWHPETISRSQNCVLGGGGICLMAEYEKMLRKRIPFFLGLLAAAGIAVMLFWRFGRHFLSGSCIGEHQTINVNGVPIYYEKAGAGKPVILLHGNGGSHRDLARITRQLSDSGYLVYAIDSRGQGNNPPLPEYHYSDMADDVYELIRAWGLDQPALYGWSDGGIIGLLTQIRHPGTLGVLAISGANCTTDGLTDFFLQTVSFSDSIHTDPLLKMVKNEPDITREELQTIQIPVLVTAGEHDIIRPEHTQMIADSLPNSTLHIFPGESHGSYITGSEKMGELLVRFLDVTGDGSLSHALSDVTENHPLSDPLSDVTENRPLSHHLLDIDLRLRRASQIYTGQILLISSPDGWPFIYNGRIRTAPVLKEDP